MFPEKFFDAGAFGEIQGGLPFVVGGRGIGAVIGGWLFGMLGIAAGGLVRAIITATVGAVVLLFIVRLIKKA